MDTNWVYWKGLPEHLLVQSVPQTVKTKAQLIGHFEAQLPPAFSKPIVDIELFQKGADSMASVKYISGEACYRAFVEVKSNLIFTAALDRDQMAYRRRIAVVEHLALMEQAKRDQERRDHRTHEPAYRCRVDVTCIAVDYEFFPHDMPSRDLLDVFRTVKFSPLEVERHSACWHVHFREDSEAEACYTHRYSFVHNGHRIRPYMLDRPVTRREREQRPVSRHNTRESTPQRPKPDDCLDRIRDKIVQKTLEPKPVSFKILELPPTRLDDNLVKLPNFNRKYLEKLQELANIDDDESEMVEEDSEQIGDVDVDMADAVPIEPETVTPIQLQETPVQSKRMRKARSKSDITDEVEPLFPSPCVKPNAVGCARLLGYVKQNPDEKTVWFEPILPQSSNQNVHQTGAQEKRPGRGARRTESGLSELIGKLNSLHLRQKQVILGKSSIHSYGLFSGEDIEPGELVIEYVGEVIRHSVANIREKKLEEQLRAAGSSEMASSYFFRLDLTNVIDATHTGNLARFVNHCCDPNCIAKVVELEGSQHIVFYARKPIGRGEEITYDYKFAIEDDPAKKIRCLCGTAACRKYLN